MIWLRTEWKHCCRMDDSVVKTNKQHFCLRLPCSRQKKTQGYILYYITQHFVLQLYQILATHISNLIFMFQVSDTTTTMGCYIFTVIYSYILLFNHIYCYLFILIDILYDILYDILVDILVDILDVYDVFLDEVIFNASITGNEFRQIHDVAGNITEANVVFI